MTTTTSTATELAVESMSAEELLAGLEALAPPEERQTDTAATLNDLRERAKALGYKTIHKRGGEYRLINADGVPEAGGTSLGTVSWLLSNFEETQATLDAGGVVIYSTACGIPQSAHDKHGEIALDDPRVVALLAEAA